MNRNVKMIALDKKRFLISLPYPHLFDGFYVFCIFDCFELRNSVLMALAYGRLFLLGNAVVLGVGMYSFRGLGVLEKKRGRRFSNFE